MTDAPPQPSVEAPIGDTTSTEDQVSETPQPDEDAAAADAAVATERSETGVELEEEGEVAADYLEGLLDITDLDGDIDMDVEGRRAMVAVVGDRLSHLAGDDGAVLEALQELTRLAVQQQTGERSRLMLDVGGFRERRRAELTKLAEEAIAEVRRTGESQRLAAMPPFERKCVHDVVAAAGLKSESDGEEPARRVVVLPS